MAARPPNPLADGSDCEEVSHEGIIKLNKSGGILRLENTLSREICDVAADTALHFAGKYSYICSGGQTKWVSGLLHWSVWKSGGKLFVYRKHPDGWETKWLEDLAKQYTLHYLRLGDEFEGNIQVFAFHTKGPSNAFLFIAVEDILKAVGLPHDSKYISNGFSHSWAAALARLGCHEEHILQTVGTSNTDDGSQNLRLHTTALSVLGGA